MTNRHRYRRFARRPAPFWIAVVALTILTVSTVDHLTSAAAAERDRWGERRAVVVARHDLEPGDTLTDADVDVRLLPAALVPDGALRHADGQVVTAWIAAGEVVMRERVAPGGLSPTAARLPPGTRGVAVPQGVAPLPVEIGDRVDVIATVDTTSVTVAEDATVVAVAEDSVTVAVDSLDAPRVALAVASAAVTLALSGAR